MVLKKFAVIALSVAVVGAVVFLLLKPTTRDHKSRVYVDPRSAEAQQATKERMQAQGLYGSGQLAKAEVTLTEFVATYVASKDRDTQDQVAAARMTLGYISANGGDMKEARERFLELDKSYEGTGTIDPSYGMIDDQAAYQAIVCLQADGEIDEAIKEYEQFIVDRPQSPLVNAVYKRLIKLLPDEQGRYEAMLQTAIDEQDALMKIEIAKCGPRAVHYLFRVLDKKGVSEDDLFKAFKTDESGTTMSNMISGLEEFGVQATGMKLNYQDFQEAKKPMIWLTTGHYVLVLKVDEEEIEVYDPLYKSKRISKIPEEKKLQFTATVLELKLEGLK